MIAPQLFPQLAIEQAMIISPSKGALPTAVIPPGVYVMTYRGGGGGGADQYFTYNYEQAAGAIGQYRQEAAYITDTAAFAAALTIGVGGAINASGTATVPGWGTVAASGGIGATTKNSPQTGESVPQSVADVTGLSAFNDPVSFTFSSPGQAGRGYKSGVGGPQAGKNGYLLLKRIA